MLRIFGFVKRLATVSLQVLPGASLAILATIRKFMNVCCNLHICMYMSYQEQIQQTEIYEFREKGQAYANTFVEC